VLRGGGGDIGGTGAARCNCFSIEGGMGPTRFHRQRRRNLAAAVTSIPVRGGHSNGWARQLAPV
jgi:hypothetical protein